MTYYKYVLGLVFVLASCTTHNSTTPIVIDRTSCETHGGVSRLEIIDDTHYYTVCKDNTFFVVSEEHVDSFKLNYID